MLKNAGLWGAFLALGVGLFFLIYALQYPIYSSIGPGAGLIPLSISAILVVLALLLIGQSIKHPQYFRDLLPKNEAAKKTLLTLFSAVLFLLLIPFTGFIVAGFVLLFILYVRQYRWYVSAGMALGVSVFLFWVFGILLHIPFPVNALGW